MPFVDTSFWYALVRPTDNHHHAATDLAQASAGTRLTTSTVVVGETWTLLRRRFGFGRAWEWLDRIQAETHVRIARVTADDEAEAWAWLRMHDERPYSFVDATSFALMRRLRIREALAFDGDFAAAGFVELRP